MFQTIVLVGNVGKEPEMKYTPNGKAVTTFSIAVNEVSGENKKTTWFRATAWDKLAETCSQYVHKGDKVLIEGRLNSDADGNPRTWTDQSGTTRASFEVTASVVRFLGSKQEAQQGTPAPVNEEDLPF